MLYRRNNSNHCFSTQQINALCGQSSLQCTYTDHQALNVKYVGKVHWDTTKKKKKKKEEREREKKRERERKEEEEARTECQVRGTERQLLLANTQIACS
jgi:3-polyprenyl-4-hydroxybenzoate decarboxylase